ncbi:hypothetical protein [Methylocella silvestris]|uniref:Histidine phosphatase family protein n=1 Tax=Methylocella silvestris TaxID=199596 RepID=A0A2J7TC26_METSI|nr:hypothetical protein [Methylocella silvestris]PNG24316.1 hypothetical protein CR492_19380 [Methylocella silvestris]
MPCEKIMLIRHAERPSADKKFRGVSIEGRKDRESLTVRGWQRAGALVRLFAPSEGHFAGSALARPQALYACKADARDPSLRPQMTLLPMAEWLGAPLNRDFYHGQEDALVECVRAGAGPALIAWKHDAMHLIANEILGDDTIAPQHWPYERYDVVWVFDRTATSWTFSQLPELLLAGDRAEPIL